jgi:hypothetical protein
MLTVPWLTARETAALIVVAVSLLFFRVFRERCLLVWGAGWVAYGAFPWVAAGELHGPQSRWRHSRRPTLCWRWDLFAAAALISAQARRALTAWWRSVGADGFRRHAALLFSRFKDSKTVDLGWMSRAG